MQMDKRRAELSKLTSYIQRIDSEVTMILQSLQWDRKHLTEDLPKAPCKYDCSHTVSLDRLDFHERKCCLQSVGYSINEQLLPEPVDANADTLISLNKDDISNIIDYAAKIDPLFRKGRGPEECQPLTLERLQEAYSMDERRAIHDAVVSAVPSCHHLLELALPHGDGSQPAAAGKSHAAVLAELRDMKRRRTKYRGAAKTRNYSDVLRDLIATQMEHYSEAQDAISDTSQSKSSKTTKETNSSKQYEEVHIKKEPSEDNLYHRDHESRQKDKSKGKHKEREREKRHDDYKRDRHRDERDRYPGSSKERSRDRNSYRSRDKCRKDDTGDSSHSRRKEYKEYKDGSKSSRYDDSRDKRDRGDRYDCYERSHKKDRYKRYYDSKEDDFTLKQIKREKD